MTFTIDDITRCPGLNHWHFTVTAAGQTRTLTFMKDDFELDPTIAELKAAFISRVRSAAKESGATNYAQIRAELLNKSYQI